LSGLGGPGEDRTPDPMVANSLWIAAAFGSKLQVQQYSYRFAAIRSTGAFTSTLERFVAFFEGLRHRVCHNVIGKHAGGSSHTLALPRAYACQQIEWLAILSEYSPVTLGQDENGQSRLLATSEANSPQRGGILPADPICPWPVNL